MKVLVTGKGGQLAWELTQTKPEHIELIELGIEELDITDQAAVQNAIKEHQPDAVINAAAYTAVDKAESEQKIAYAVNETGAVNLANAAKSVNAKLLHVSTDFVFSGDKVTPYQPEDEPNPLGVYGASKLAGDKAVAEIMAGQALIVRTAWVYSANGNNFVKTMLRLMSEKEQLGVIYDQVGTPTWAKGLAKWLWAALEADWGFNDTPIYHWTDAGVASWYDFAVAIQELGIEKRLINKSIPILPIPTSAYPTPAARPAFSVIDKTSAEVFNKLETVHWRKQLSAMMDELVKGS
ncbi:dTDP-4-dehydrorhamnose reductase [Neiella marina]|uniref:dTDP-4-dehydrorhamnose reductase n=1 Tax=Neiella holothuriorum TaxID=2870530 RepID=A0ABS7EEJ1_9GAMM|nr:dTDP-4-dehydrorhamnose reductase [Neiella holothuriorum]MBW8190757.1 dTDP-4-dehydrorhamnose reductase [Neiella holothuriorum]